MGAPMTRQQDRLRQCPCQCDLLAQDIACRARAGVLAVLFALTLCGAPRPARAETDEPTVPVMAAPLTPTSSPDESPVSPPAQPPSSSGPSTGQTPASAVDEMPPGTLEKWRDEAYVATQHAIESVDEALAPANSRHIPMPTPRFRIGLGGTVIKRPDKTEFDEIFDLEGSVDLPNTRRHARL